MSNWKCVAGPQARIRAFECFPTGLLTTNKHPPSVFIVENRVLILRRTKGSSLSSVKFLPTKDMLMSLSPSVVGYKLHLFTQITVNSQTSEVLCTRNLCIFRQTVTPSVGFYEPGLLTWRFLFLDPGGHRGVLSNQVWSPKEQGCLFLK